MSVLCFGVSVSDLCGVVCCVDALMSDMTQEIPCALCPDLTEVCSVLPLKIPAFPSSAELEVVPKSPGNPMRRLSLLTEMCSVLPLKLLQYALFYTECVADNLRCDLCLQGKGGNLWNQHPVTMKPSGPLAISELSVSSSPPPPLL